MSKPRPPRRLPPKLKTSPGTLLYTGVLDQPTQLSWLAYNAKGVAAAEFTPQVVLDDDHQHWLQVTGLQDLELLKTVAERFKLHNLLLEDVLHVQQRAKAEVLEGGVLVILPWMWLEGGELKRQQLSLLLLPPVLISFAESSNHALNFAGERLQDDRSRVRRLGSHYLLYLLIDQVIDQYQVVLHQTDEQLENLNSQLMNATSTDCLTELHQLKSTLLQLRKNLTPLTEIPTGIKSFFAEDELVYWQDLKDHLTHAQERVRNQIEVVDSLFNLYFSLVGLQTNRTMQTLTVITLVFLPLTLIAGIYGMNFERMPELNWSWGYPAALGLMLLIALAILWYFKRKNWF